ncbi:MAG TPA: DNA-binding protein, partial [Alphaproteobacteria bacterium]|nr:DNA-binding protein [Alphaproteobacteria bacterium]
AYALEISGESMAPAYRAGTIIIVSPTADIRRTDRVVVKTVAGEVMAKELVRKTAKKIELKSLNPDYPNRVLETQEIAFIARIVWASQ